jgi:hypothetical protein
MSIGNCGRLNIPYADCVSQYQNKDWILFADEALAVGAVDVIDLN